MSKRTKSTVPAAAGDLWTVSQAASAWDVHPSRVRQWIAEQRIPGAVLLGHTWVLPKDSPRPKSKGRSAKGGRPKAEAP